MLTGENGLLNRATDAKEQYSKSEVKEKVEMLLSEYMIKKSVGENIDFEKFLERNLQDGVLKNEDNTYSFVLGEWQVITNENKVISVEKFKLDVDKTYPNVASMKADAGLTDGQTVQTEGYWDKQYAGGAYYDIVSNTSLSVDDGKCIQLDNGLYAELHAVNDTVTVNQFGAYGDGEHDDSAAIQLTINSGYSNIVFEENEYKINKSITVSSNDLSLLGKNSTMFSSDDFSDTQEWLFIIKANNINVYSLSLEARETQAVGYKTQLGVLNSSNIDIYKCNFTVPDTAPSQTADGGKKEYTNIDLYTGWHNVSIDSCNLKVLHDGEAGGCIWIRDFYELGCDNLKFSNNTCEKICHDEILAIFSGYIEDVTISNNSFKVEEKEASSTPKIFTIGSTGSKKCSNITINENKIDAVGSNGLLWSDNATEVKFNDNEVNFIRNSSGTRLGYIFRAEIRSQVNANNNNICVENLNENYTTTIFYGCLDVKNNNITVSGKVEDCFSTCENIESNKVQLNSTCTNVFNSIGKSCKENTVNSPARIEHIFQWFSQSNITNDIIIENNTINYECDEISNNTSSMFCIINNVALNGKKIEFYNNKVKASNISPSSYLLFFIVKDTTPQTIIIKDNEIDGYSRTYIPNSNHNITIENK